MNNKSSRYSSSKIKSITLIIPYLVINYCNICPLPCLCYSFHKNGSEGRVSNLLIVVPPKSTFGNVRDLSIGRTSIMFLSYNYFPLLSLCASRHHGRGDLC